MERAGNCVALLARAALFSEPRQRLNEAAQRVDSASDALRRALRERLAAEGQRVAKARAQLREHRPDQLVALSRRRLDAVQRRFTECARQRVAGSRQRLSRAEDMLRLLSPQTVLERGFSITTLADGTVVKSARQLTAGVEIVTRVKDGTARARVEGTTALEP
jgi:exodeoxyribonuclease VII large subunit